LFCEGKTPSTPWSFGIALGEIINGRLGLKLPLHPNNKNYNRTKN
jgi:hypothetical protein